MPAPDSLLWTQTVTAAGRATHTVLIGYAEATLAGVGEDRDATVIGQEVHVAMGADASDETVVYADTLYLQAGARYEFPGKHLTIVARRLGMASANPSPATVTVGGHVGMPASPPTDPPVPALGRAATGGDHQNGANGQPGVPGKPGLPGNRGTDAGGIAVRVFEVLPSLRVVIDATGGAGSDGLQGQDGQTGQQGGERGPERKSAAAIIL